MHGVLCAALFLLLQPPAPAPVDYPGALWEPAVSTNFETWLPDAPPRVVEYVVIHDIEGAAIEAVRWFQNAQAQASAHYVVSANGIIYQQVREKDVAWHAGNRLYNRASVGIEHEGYAYRPGWYTFTEYETSASLVRAITTRYGIPRDRQHIIAHAEVPDPTDPTKFGGRSHHTDPGPGWDWEAFMTMVQNDAKVGEVAVPAAIHPGEKLPVTISLTNTGDLPWAKGIVHLGTASGQESVLRPRSWVSPRFAAGVKSDITPGEQVALTFDIQGPRTYGETTETLRLFSAPITPRQPIPFGARIPLKVTVEPWTLTALFVPEAKAWRVDSPLAGEWEVWVPEKAGRGVEIAVQVDGKEKRLRPERKAEKGWRRLGRIPVSVQKAVTLTRTRGNFTGEVRLIGPW